MNNRQLCNGGVNCIVSPWEHQGAAPQGRSASCIQKPCCNTPEHSEQCWALRARSWGSVPLQVRLWLGSLRALCLGAGRDRAAAGSCVGGPGLASPVKACPDRFASFLWGCEVLCRLSAHSPRVICFQENVFASVVGHVIILP